MAATVHADPDGQLAIRHKGVDLPHRTFDKRPQVNQAAIVENKRLGPVLAYIFSGNERVSVIGGAMDAPQQKQRSRFLSAGSGWMAPL